MLYLGYILLRYVLINNLEVSFNFHLTFLQVNVIKMFTFRSLTGSCHCTVLEKNFFLLFAAIFSELPITRTFFDFPWRFEISGVDCIAKYDAYVPSASVWESVKSRLWEKGNLRKHPFLFALRHWGRFARRRARRNGCFRRLEKGHNIIPWALLAIL